MNGLIQNIEDTTNPIAERTCTGTCGRTLPLTSEYFSLDKRRVGTLSAFSARCKDCRAKQQRESVALGKQIRSKAKQQSKSVEKVARQTLGNPDKCGCCGTEKGNILGDADRNTGEIRGYLCAKCFRLVNDFYHEPERMHNALNYIGQIKNKVSVTLQRNRH